MAHDEPLARSDELAALRDQLPPRNAALVTTLGRRFTPLWGFAAYGCLYLFVPMSIGVAALVPVANLLSESLGNPLPGWALALVFAAFLAGFFLGWWPFSIWFSRRRRAAYRLFSHGQFVEAAVVQVDVWTVKGHPITRARLEVSGHNEKRTVVLSIDGRPAGVEVGASIPLLIEPTCSYVAGFVNGRAVAAA